jgi:hypothetical protein
MEEDEHAFRRRRLVEGEHAGVVDEEILIIRVELEAPEPLPPQRPHLLDTGGVGGVHGGQRRNARLPRGAQPLLHGRHLLRLGRHGSHDGKADPGGCHGPLQPLQGAVGGCLDPRPRADRPHGAVGEALGPDVGMEVDLHGLILYAI